MSGKLREVAHAFVEFLPPQLEKGTVYVSIAYKTIAHLCCCGCGKKVVTPISPTGWQVSYDGKSISISPSIGSWNLDCQSHYWITKGRVWWADQWSKHRIAAGFLRDQKAKQDYYDDPATFMEAQFDDDGPWSSELRTQPDEEDAAPESGAPFERKSLPPRKP